MRCGGGRAGVRELSNRMGLEVTGFSTADKPVSQIIE